MDKKEYMKQWHIKHREEVIARQKLYRETHKKEIKKHRDEHKDYYKNYYNENKEKWNKKHLENYNTPIGRATCLLRAYTNQDIKHNRGEGDLTPEWIIENIFSKPCAHCGKTGWEVIGCNRLDNSKPHSKDNVEPCCEECNNELAIEEQKKRVYQYTLDGELVAIWPSANEAARKLKFCQAHITDCCNGKRKTHKGYTWSYIPL